MGCLQNEKYICDEPNEDGNYLIRNSYSYVHYAPDKDDEHVTVDISDTVKKVRYYNRKRR